MILVPICNPIDVKAYHFYYFKPTFVGHAIVIEVIFSSFRIIAPPELFCINGLTYRPVRSQCTKFYSFISAIIFCGRFP